MAGFKPKPFKYYFTLWDLCFVPGKRFLFANEYTYIPVATPMEVNDDFYIAVEDLKRIYAPDFAVKFTDETHATFTHEGKTASAELIALEGHPAAPVKKLLLGCFGKTLSKAPSHEGHVCYQVSSVGHDDVDWNMGEDLEGGMSHLVDLVVRGKKDGDLNCTFWFPEADKLMAYYLYVPTNYDPSKPAPLITFLHGGSPAVNMGSHRERAKGMIQYYAEDLGWFVVFPVCLYHGGAWGYKIPPNRSVQLDPACPENPGHYPPERLREIELSERGLDRTIEDVCAKYSIDRTHLYLTGNSMGGIGTFYYAAAHPGMFRAIAPTGAFCNADLFPAEGLRGTPIFQVAGTEDRYGYDYMRYDYEVLKRNGYDITLRTIGGGPHGYAWITALEETFDFFKKHF